MLTPTENVFVLKTIISFYVVVLDIIQVQKKTTTTDKTKKRNPSLINRVKRVDFVMRLNNDTLIKIYGQKKTIFHKEAF